MRTLTSSGCKPLAISRLASSSSASDVADELRRVSLGELHDAGQARAVQLADELEQFDRLVEDARDQPVACSRFELRSMVSPMSPRDLFAVTLRPGPRGCTSSASAPC